MPKPKPEPLALGKKKSSKFSRTKLLIKKFESEKTEVSKLTEAQPTARTTLEFLYDEHEECQHVREEMEMYGNLLRIFQYTNEDDKYVSNNPDSLFYRV